MKRGRPKYLDRSNSSLNNLNSNAAMRAAVSGTSSVGNCKPIKIKLNILIPLNQNLS